MYKRVVAPHNNVYQIINTDDYLVYGIMAFSLPVQPAEATENQVRTLNEA